MATAGTTGYVVVWNLDNVSINTSSNDRVTKLTDHNQLVNRVSWHPTLPHILYSCSQDKTVKMWDLRESGGSRATFNCQQPVRAVSGSPHFPNYLAAATDNGTCQVWDIRKDTMYVNRVSAHNGPVYDIAWHPSDAQLFATCGRDGTVKVCNLGARDNKSGASIRCIGGVARTVWHPEQTTQLSTICQQFDARIQLWDLDRPYVALRHCEPHTLQPTGILFNERGECILSCGKDGRVIRSELEKAVNPRSRLPKASVSFSPLGMLVSSFSGDESITQFAPSTPRDGSVAEILDVTQHYLSPLACHPKHRVLSPAAIAQHQAMACAEGDMTGTEIVWKQLAEAFVLNSGITTEAAAALQPEENMSSNPASPVGPGMRDRLNKRHFRNASSSISGGGGTANHALPTTSFNLDDSTDREFSDNESTTSNLSSRSNIFASSIDANDDILVSAALNMAMADATEKTPSSGLLRHTNLSSCDLVGFSEADSLDPLHAGGLVPLSTLAQELCRQPVGSVLRNADLAWVATFSEPLLHLYRDPFEDFRKPGDDTSHPLLTSSADGDSTDALNDSVLLGAGQSMRSGSKAALRHTSSNDHAMLPVLSVLEPYHVLSAAVNYACETNDAPLAAFILYLCSDEVAASIIDSSSRGAALSGFIDMLRMSNSHIVAAEALLSSPDPTIRSESTVMTTIYATCPSCDKPLPVTIPENSEERLICPKCAQRFGECSICRKAVDGVYVMCQGCGHGGHVGHLQDWFRTNTVCPTGCGHSCQPCYLE